MRCPSVPSPRGGTSPSCGRSSCGTSAVAPRPCSCSSRPRTGPPAAGLARRSGSVFADPADSTRARPRGRSAQGDRPVRRVARRRASITLRSSRDVARPVVPRSHGERLLGWRRRPAGPKRGVHLGKAVGEEQRDVLHLAPAAAGRWIRATFEPIVEVLPEPALGHRGVPDPGWWRRRRARRAGTAAAARLGWLHLPCLDRAQDLGLGRTRLMSPISSNRTVPPSASFIFPTLGRFAPVKAPLSYPRARSREEYPESRHN